MNSPFSKTIRDGKGNLIGSEREVEGYGSDISDEKGNRLGSTTTFGTFDNKGNRESDSDMPGLLIDKD